MQVDFIPHNTIRLYAHIGEELVLPVPFDGTRNFVARYTYKLSHRQTGDADEYVVVVGISSIDGDAPDVAFLNRPGIIDYRFDFSAVRGYLILCTRAEWQEHQEYPS
jgi:limonene-1,2-epoxide hydrolase